MITFPRSARPALAALFYWIAAAVLAVLVSVVW